MIVFMIHVNSKNFILFFRVYFLALFKLYNAFQHINDELIKALPQNSI